MTQEQKSDIPCTIAKKNRKNIRAVKIHLSLNLVTFLPISTVMFFIYIKKHMK